MTLLDPEADGARAAPAGSAARALYQAAWRWHFYAGLFVAPFLCLLALTGLVMLWAGATAGVSGERAAVPVRGEWQPAFRQVLVAQGAVPGGTAVQYVEPHGPGRAALVRVSAEAGDTAVLVDPYAAEVIATFGWDDTLYAWASDVHGTLLLGTAGDRLIELAAGFGVVLIVTGLFLWWPRRPGRGPARGLILAPSRAARGRAWWLWLHASVGFWTAALLLAFLVSGLSWTGVWGERFVQAWSTFPAEKWDAVPLSDATHGDMDAPGGHGVPWALEQAPLPASGSLAGTAAVAPPVTLDGVVAFARSLGFRGRFQLDLPRGEAGVWTISHDSQSHDGPNPGADRTLHLDRHTGRVLADVRFADYSAYAKAMAVGVAFHQGDLGAWNLALNTLVCLAVLLLSASGLVLWWRRRPARARRLAAPPAPERLPGWKGAALLAVLLGLALPLVGLALVAVLALDVLVVQRVPALRRALS